MVHEVIVIGAGVAGLQCARELSRRGVEVLVLDRADKPGGRCATRSFDGALADYGPLFLHGSDPSFLEALRAASGSAIEGWPSRVKGKGKPCQPEAFGPWETRLGFPQGVNAFPKALAEGLPISLHVQVTAIETREHGFTVQDANGQRFDTHDLVLAVAHGQAQPLLRQLEPREGVSKALALLGMFGTVPCLTLIAGYPPGLAMPPWDVLYPEEDEALLLVGNESGKRGSPVLVVQAAPRWSRVHLEEPKESWAVELLSHAAGVIGPWASAPAWTHPHRWRYSRLDRANELAAPLLVPVGHGRVGMCGELFAAGGGVQAAWKSGGEMARRLAVGPS